jgi:hypothetical protein
MKKEHLEAERDGKGSGRVSVGHDMQRAGGNKQGGTFF